ncbi:MAG: acyltransferase [Burkholderiales bacterium]|nr:acyltransferase [Burkholderiales bacterium]
MAGTGAPAAAPAGFFPSIALIRAIAALLVAWDHLFNVWPQRNGIELHAVGFVERWVLAPLALMQHGGAFAVALFFMVSGFIIVAVGVRESGRTFAIRRALRIYPPLWVSCILLLVAFPLAIAATGSADLLNYEIAKVIAKDDPWPSIALALSLANYLVGTPAVNGVAWTLVIEVLFYVCVLALLPLLRARPRVAIGVAFGALGVLHMVAKSHWVVFLLAVNGTYVTFLFLGTLVYLRHAQRIGNAFFATMTALFWGLFILGVERHVAQPPWTVTDYGVSYALAWLVFVALLLVDRHLRVGPVLGFYSRISYSFYLNHGGLGFVALALLVPSFGYPLAVAITLVLVTAVSALSYRFVELPAQRLARRLTARRGAPGTASDAG